MRPKWMVWIHKAEKVWVILYKRETFAPTVEGHYSQMYGTMLHQVLREHVLQDACAPRRCIQGHVPLAR